MADESRRLAQSIRSRGEQGDRLGDHEELRAHFGIDMSCTWGRGTHKRRDNRVVVAPECLSKAHSHVGAHDQAHERRSQRKPACDKDHTSLVIRSDDGEGR